MELKKNRLIYVFLLLIGAFAIFLTQALGSEVNPPEPPAERKPMQLPANYTSELVQYARVDRSDGVSRNLYVTRHTLSALQRGEPIPEESLFLIEAFDIARGDDGEWLKDEDGYYVQAERHEAETHASEMRTSWRVEDMQIGNRPGDWNFARFALPDGAQIRQDISDCFSCHESAASREFVFSLPQLRAFAQTGEIQISFCPRPERDICF